MNPTIEGIETELNKIFVSLDSKWVKTSFILSKLELPINIELKRNKFSLELRYPITLKPSASIYALTFLEAGNGYDSFREFNPFNSKRSAGLGVRIFMPAFGLLGIDFGYGFDNPAFGILEPNGWETHFLIGQQF